MVASPLDGPIPGENFTSDTRNYPWHRPPEFTEPDEAIEYALEVMTEEEGSIAIISMLEMGISVVAVTDMILTKGIMSGKWTFDLSMLIAGPIAHIIVLMAKGYDIDYELGVDRPSNIPTSSFFKEAKKINQAKAKAVGEDVALEAEAIGLISGSANMNQTVSPATDGFMGGFDQASAGPEGVL